MKKLISFLLCLSLVFLSYGQDARQRTVETLVADVLAQLPAQRAADFEADCADLAAAAPKSVELLAAQMAPAEKGGDNLLEYALSGVVDYVNAPGREALRSKVNAGLSTAISQCKDLSDKAFLLYQLRSICTEENLPLLKQCAETPELAAVSLSMISALPSAGEQLLGLFRDDRIGKGSLAASAASLGLAGAAPFLEEWISAGTLGKEDRQAVYRSLAKVGGKEALPTLKAVSLPDYAVLAERLALGGEKRAALKAARTLLRTGENSLMTKGAHLTQLIKGEKAGLRLLKTALKGGDRAYRNALLEEVTALCGVEKVSETAASRWETCPEACRTDIVNWAGSHKALSLSSRVIEALTAPGELGNAAVTAAGKFGTEEAAKVLLAQLGGEKAALAATALKAIRGVDLKALIGNALQDKGLPTPAMKQILAIASAKKMTDCAPTAFSLIQKAADKELAAAAAGSLAGLVDAGDIAAVSALLSEAAGEEVAPLQRALVSALHALPAERQYEEVKAQLGKAACKANFYPALASTGTDTAVNDLLAAFDAGESEALASLVKINNFKAAPGLLAIARKQPGLADAVLTRYVALTGEYEPNPDKKRLDYAEALSLAQSPEVKNGIIGAIAAIPTMKAFLLAGRCLDEEATAYAAAAAVKHIAATTKEEIDYQALKANLEKAAAVFAARKGADDGYAVDQIKKMLSEAEPSPIFHLSEEEEKQGFEILFDGTGLDKWQGDLEGYTPVNGTILVSANYGASGNLYTRKEYRNFVFRFEFCFLRPGVNNGVGVRTPIGVDAAYGAMCEVQILDHDAPMYKNLHKYQVHGSVYGVIPAKRIVHKPLGEWGVEEIRVEGDHVKVTVNGEVIVDGNLRKACKGHNVAPDGSTHNPYTVDHRNHPGMFNRKGHVSFCGHGSGLKLRNVRILDLGDGK